MKIKGKWLWIAQRVTSGLLMLDAFATILWWATHTNFNRQDLVDYLSMPLVATVKALVLLLLVLHAGIGMWAIGTDYIRPMQFGAVAGPLRLLYELAVAALLLATLYYGFQVLV